MPNYNGNPPLGLDYAGGRIAGQHIRDNTPYSFVCRYLSDGGSSLPGKQLLPSEARDLMANDIAIISNWETWADRMKGGGVAGTNDAMSAWSWHKSCGGPDDATIYFSADWDVAPNEQGPVNDYLKAAIEYLGIQSVGVYGGYYTCKRAREAFPGIKVWQTLAWSGGQILPDIEILQRIGFVNVAGVQCDVNELRKPGHAGAWQDVTQPTEQENNMANITSLVDGSTMTTEQALAYVDFHAFNADERTKQLVELQTQQNNLLQQILTKLGG